MQADRRTQHALGADEPFEFGRRCERGADSDALDGGCRFHLTVVPTTFDGESGGI